MLRGQREARLRGPAPAAVELPLPELREGHDAAADEDARDRAGSSTLRLPAHPRDAATRGLEGESQEGVPALSARGTLGADQEAEEAGEPPARRTGGAGPG